MGFNANFAACVCVCAPQGSSKPTFSLWTLIPMYSRRQGGVAAVGEQRAATGNIRQTRAFHCPVGSSQSFPM